MLGSSTVGGYAEDKLSLYDPTLWKKAFENIVITAENACNKHFILLQQRIFTLQKGNLSF